MQFAAPAALLFGLLAIPIVIFYILKIRLRRIPISTVMFWNQIYDEKKPRSIWQRFRHLVSLLMQLAFLALLTLAVADPFFAWQKKDVRRLVLVVDNSASMRATDVAPNRLQQSRQQGHTWIRGLRLEDEMAIVSAGSTPRVEVGLTSHLRTLHDALDAISATDGPTHVAEAIELAGSLIADHSNGRVLVLTDGRFAGVETISQDDHVSLVVVGEETANIGITQFQVRRSLLDVVGYQILVEVTNASPDPKSCRLEVTLEDQLVDVVPLELAAEERWTHVLDHTSAEGGRLVATLDIEDALVTDNRAVALLPKRQRQPVTLVTQGSLFLQSALASLPLVELTITAESPTAVPPGSTLVYHDVTPATVPAGNSLFIQPSGDSNLWKLGEPVAEPIVTRQDTDSLLMTHVQLTNVVMPSARQIEFADDVQVLAESLGKQPLYTAIEHPQGKSLVLTVDLDQGDLPLRTAFPIMMANAMTWFQGQQGELREALASGSRTRFSLPRPVMQGGNAELDDTRAAAARGRSRTGDPAGVSSRTRDLFVRAPDGTEQPLPADIESVTIGPLDLCGIWQVIAKPTSPTTDAPVTDAAITNSPGTDSPGTGSQSDAQPTIESLGQFACNLANRDESDIRVTAQDDDPVAAGLLGGRPLWFYLVVVGFLLTASEWFLYQRRWIS